VAAWRLARAGVPAVLFERCEEPGSRAACGGVMLHALAERLELAPELVDAEVSRLWVVEGARRDRIDFRSPVFVSFDRRRLDAFLARRAASSGCELRTGSAVTGWDPDSGTLHWRDSEGPQEQAFDTVVFADGPASVARERGLGLVGSAPMAAAFYRELEGGWPDPDEIELHLAMPDDDPGYLWVFPKHGSVQVGVGRAHSVRRRPLRQVLDQHIRSDQRLAGRAWCRSRGGMVPLSLARRVASPGALVVGDAAGMVNPITGGGLVYAVASGEMAARAISEAWCRDRDPAWAATRYQRLFWRSVHHLWLRSVGLPSSLNLRRLARGRRSFFRPLFLLYAKILPSLTATAQAVTRPEPRGC